MSAYSIVQQLHNTQNDTAIGIGYILKALLDFATHQSGRTPVIVEHMKEGGTTEMMMFSRELLLTTFDVSRSGLPLHD